MSNDGWYYLHTNGELIWKKCKPEDDSPFVKRIWSVDTTDRMNAWKIVLEAFLLGGRGDRIKELAQKWHLTFEDSIEMLKHASENGITDEIREGLPLFVACILQMNPDDYWKKVKEIW